ncbi:TonB-dependent siderophore receptor [Steroidobacter sp.]|uniref:TonB-dependent siderophore receptor n=1 Tax=Steroidobacter sp. TaxID=1978227 RepID=UPI001A5AA649|nr:TonB-dependent receptor [Steroidobacter sp.]MBL8265890.1 TonB-dependent siderophore receptor [Steroidobacter sp.]
MKLRSMILVGAVSALLCGPASAESLQTQAVPFSIERQPLEDALAEFARQTGYQLLFQSDVALKLTAPRVAGTLTPESALKALLENSGLHYKFVNAKTVTIGTAADIAAAGSMRRTALGGGAEERTAATDKTVQEVETVIVKGTTIDDPILSSRFGDTLRERPQSISMVTRERLDEQNLNSLDEALAQTTGITLTKESSTATQFFSRGFEIRNVQVDGGSPLSINAGGYDQQIDLAFYEQIEVLRGGDALFSGNGDPGGTIQLVRKRPTSKTQLSVEASAGRWNSYRGNLDLSGSMAMDGRVRGRAVYMRESTESFQDDVIRGQRDALYLAMEADLTDSTKLFLGGSYTSSLSPIGGFGLPRYNDGRDLGLPRSVSLTSEWSKADTDTGEVFATLDQRIGDHWQLRVNAMRSHKDSDFAFLYSFSSIDPTTGLGRIYGTNAQRTAVQEVMDITLKGSFELFGRTHKVAFGADWQESETDGPSWNMPAYYINPYSFDPSAYPAPSRAATPDSTSSFGNEQSGAYVSLSLQATDAMRILGGARYSNYEYNSAYPAFDSYTHYEDRAVVTPYIGMTYELPKGWVAYGSYAENFSSQASMHSGPFPGSPLDPITGETIELGIKGDLGSGRAATQIAVYRTERNGEAIQDLSYPPQSGALGVACCYLAKGVVESRGLDAEINGRITDRWGVFAGYTFNENEYKSGYTSSVGAYMPRTPKHLFKLWSTYQFDGSLARLKVSGGVNAQSGNYRTGTAAQLDGSGAVVAFVPFEFSQGGYSIFSARAEYLINQTWSASLNLDNIFDKTYYSTVGTTSAGNWYGLPRSYTLSIRGKW